MIFTRRGTVLPLDQRRRDALMTYAQIAADEAGVPRQTWCRRVWKLTDYEAKDLLKANASENVWEKILKSKHPEHGGWSVALPVMAAVIGQELHVFFRNRAQLAARAHDNDKEHERLARAAYRRLAGDADGPGDDRDSAAATREARRSFGTLGADQARRVGRDR